MLQESVSNEEQVFVLTWQAALVDHEVALVVAALVQVLLWVNLEHVITHLESNWFHLRADLLTRLLDVAESLV